MSGGTTNSTTETSSSCMPDAEDRYWIPEGKLRKNRLNWETPANSAWFLGIH